VVVRGKRMLKVERIAMSFRGLFYFLGMKIHHDAEIKSIPIASTHAGHQILAITQFEKASAGILEVFQETLVS